jgi:tetratricopeptide (TPR) repeat protein
MLKPAWEQNWFRGSIIGTASASGRAKAVRYVSEAIRLSPKDNPELRAMWGYLGGLHLNQEDYKQAEASFKAELALLQAQKNPKPDELAGAYGGLRMVYYRTGNLQGQKECLRKEIEFCRAARGPDSPAENSLWYDLAQVTHDSGDSRQAQALLDRAINMEAARHDPAAPIGYWKRKLHDWKNE